MNDHRNLHHHQRRLGLRAGLVGCLVLLQVVAAQAATDLALSDAAYTRFRAVVTGNAATVSYGSTGAVLSSASSLPSVASVAGLSPTAGEVSRFGSFSTKYGQIAFKASQTITAANLAKGIGAIAGGPLGIGLFALSFTADWLADSGYRHQDGELQAVDPATLAPADYDGNLRKTPYTVNSNSRADACLKFSQYKKATNPSFNWPVTSCTYGGVEVGQFYTSGVDSGSREYASFQVTADPNPPVPTWAPADASGVASALEAKARTSSEIEQILSETIKYPEIQPDPVDWVRIDPINPGDYIKSPTKTDQKTTTNPDGSTVEETKSCWVKGTVQTGASLKLTEVCNTDTVSKSPTGTVTGTTTATTDSESADAATPKDEGGLCDTLIGKLVCTDLGDAPTDEIPKTTKDLSYTPEVLFGSGACPADKVVTMGALTVPLTNMAQTCGWLADFVKPLAILLATFSATLIVIGAPKE